MSSAERARERRREIREGTYEPRRRCEELPWPRNAEDGTPLGVDLSRRYQDVRALVLSYQLCPPPDGLSPEDLVHEVCMVIQRRNRTPSAHDPRRSGLGNYVRLVWRTTSANLAGRARRETLLGGPPPDVPVGPSFEALLEACSRILAAGMSGGATGAALRMLRDGVPPSGADAREIMGALGAVGP